MTGAYSDWLEERGSKWSRELDFNSVQKELHNNKCFSAMNESYCRGYCKKCSFSSPSEMQRNLLGMVKCLEKCFSILQTIFHNWVVFLWLEQVSHRRLVTSFKENHRKQI